MNIKRILISQAAPNNLTPYSGLIEKFGVNIDFKPFFLIEPVSSKMLRSYKFNISDYTAIVFTSRHTVNSFFKHCEELRLKVPDTMKYFCSTEAVAMYLQKYIVYRKRKVFYGIGSPDSIIEQIGTKHKDEKFLVTIADYGSDTVGLAFAENNLNYVSIPFVTAVYQDLKSVDINSYDIIAIYNPADLASLRDNFPENKFESTKFLTFGRQTAKAMEEVGLPIEIQAPTTTAPSVAMALEQYLEKK